MVLRGARRFGLVLARGRVRRLLLLAGLVFAALPAGSALADTTIGQVGGDRPCGGSAVSFADLNYVVPSGGGKITSFSFQSVPQQNDGQQLDFLVWRPLQNDPQPVFGDYSVVGKTGLVTLTGTGLETFQVTPPISVRAGDILGFWEPSGLDNCRRAHVSGGGFIYGSTSDPNVGDVFELDRFDEADVNDLNESANLVPAVSLPPPPTSTQQCKHGGWKNFGSRFKNQGQCVRFVNSHHNHKHHPSGLPVRVWGS